MGRIPKLEKEKRNYNQEECEYSLSEQRSVPDSYLNENTNTRPSTAESLRHYDQYDSCYECPKSNEFISDLVDYKLNNHRNSYFNSIDKDHLLFALVRNKSIDLYKEFMNAFSLQFDKFEYLVENDEQLMQMHANLNDIIKGIMLDVCGKVEAIVNYAAKLPGFSALERSDLNLLIKQNLFPLHLTATSKLYTEHKLYYLLPNGVYFSRSRMIEALGEEITYVMFMTSKIINEIDMCESELALLFPFVLSKNSECLSNEHLCKEINEFYKQALFKEFEINN